ncbi:MAG: class I SAM-dependent methyltransferase [Actinomycetota bacterium]
MASATTQNEDWIRRWATDDGLHYVAEADRYDNLNGPSGKEMLDAAHLQTGERVLDVGCGSGAITIEAARRVQPGGAVLGVDVSPPLLALARERAAAAGADDIEFIEADAQVHRFGDGSFDVVISRNGLMYFDDADAGFANLVLALRPGGRLAFTAPQGLDRNEWIMVAGAAAAPHIGMPQGIVPGAPGPLGLADSDRTSRVLEGAGFTDVTLEDLTLSMRIGDDVEDALSFIRSIPFVRDLLAAAPAPKQNVAVDAVRTALAPYAGRDGVVTHNNGVWLVTARR